VKTSPERAPLASPSWQFHPLIEAIPSRHRLAMDQAASGLSDSSPRRATAHGRDQVYPDGRFLAASSDRQVCGNEIGIT
jgi:hypothetical protein